MRKTIGAVSACVIASAIGGLLGGCGGGVSAASPTQPLVGLQCEVQFQRQLLGAAADLPVSPTTNEINGAATSVSGILKHVGAEWIVLERTSASPTSEELWIPRSAVLLLRTHRP